MRHSAKIYRMFCKYLLPIIVFCFAHPWTGFAETGSSKRGITADDLLAVRDIKTMALSPDGSRVAYQVVQADKDENSYSVSWYVAATSPNAKPQLVADGGESGGLVNSLGTPMGGVAPSEIVWSPDSEWIFFTKRKQGAVQLWRSHFSRYGQEQLTHNKADVEAPKYVNKDSKLLFTVGRRRIDIEEANKRESQQGYLMQEPKIYSVQKGPVWPPCSDGRLRWSVYENESRACTLTVWAFDIEADVERKAVIDEIEAYYAEADTSESVRIRRGRLKDQSRKMEVWSPDGSRSAWFENENPSVFKGYLPPVRVATSDGGEVLRCPVDVCSSERPVKIWWNSDGTEVIFLVRDGPRFTLNSIYAWRPGESEARTILRTDDMFYDCTIDGNRLICGHESWISPRKIVSVELGTGKIYTIVDVNPVFQNLRFTKIEKIVSEDNYGNVTHAHLVYPKAYREGMKYPLVIVQYRSRGFLRGGVGDEHPIHVLAQNGFVVLSFDTPEGDYLTKTVDSVEIQKRYLRYLLIKRGPATAVERMVDELNKRGIIDPERVGITGLSHGAITVDTALLARNYAAASVAYSYMAPPNFDVSSSSFWGKAMDGAFGGTPYSEVGFETRAKHSVGVNAGRIDTPLLIQVADREYYTTLQNYNALKDAGKPVEMYIFPDEYHIKWQPAHRYAVYSRNIDWFNFWLRDIEDKDVAKTEQYRRWRIMKEQHRANLQRLN